MRNPTLLLVAALPLALGACSDETPLAPDDDDLEIALEELRSATAPYHDLDAAIADGFVMVTECEQRPGESPVGSVYANPERFDGTINTAAPEALLYEPGGNGESTLVGVELVIPYAAWTAEAPPEFQGEEFQREDEFDIFGLHVWVWRFNPEGAFAIGNPRVSCEAS